jgi:hypothetical protein
MSLLQVSQGQRSPQSPHLKKKLRGKRGSKSCDESLAYSCPRERFNHINDDDFTLITDFPISSCDHGYCGKCDWLEDSRDPYGLKKWHRNFPHHHYHRHHRRHLHRR